MHRRKINTNHMKGKNMTFRYTVYFIHLLFVFVKYNHVDKNHLIQKLIMRGVNH